MDILKAHSQWSTAQDLPPNSEQKVCTFFFWFLLDVSRKRTVLLIACSFLCLNVVCALFARWEWCVSTVGSTKRGRCLILTMGDLLVSRRSSLFSFWFDENKNTVKSRCNLYLVKCFFFRSLISLKMLVKLCLIPWFLALRAKVPTRFWWNTYSQIWGKQFLGSHSYLW